MSDCENEQLELNLKTPELPEMYRRFREKMLRLVHEHGVSEAVCAELRNWGQFNDFPQVASWTRRLLRDHETSHYANAASVLLTCFGIAFRGDLVGHIGRDLLIAPLHSDNQVFRRAAVGVLVRWLEYDEDGMWHDMAEDHIERETNPGHVDQLMQAMDLDEEVLEPSPLMEEWLEVRRGCEVEMRGTAPMMHIRPVICQLTGLPPSVLGSIIEYIQFPPQADIESVMERLNYTHPATKHLGVLWSEVGDGRHLRVWDTNGSFAFSVEPTATEGRWLFFCHLR